MQDQARTIASQMLVGAAVRLAAAGSSFPSCLILSFAFMFVALHAQAESAPMFRGSIEHSGVYKAAGAPALSGVQWTFHAKGMLIASPAVDDATVYAGSTGGLLYAVDRASGTEKWEFDTKSRIASSPAVDHGLVFFGAYDGNFYAVETGTGKLRWKFKTGGERQFAAEHLHGMQPETEIMPDPWDCYLSSPAVWDGAIYFGSGDGNVYALDAGTGALKWKFKTGDVVHASPAIADGLVFIGSWDSYFYALDAVSGTEKWRFKTGEDAVNHNQVGIQSSAAVVDGTVFFGCRDSHLYALDEFTGKQKWAYATGGTWVLTSPAVSGGRVYFAISFGGRLFAADEKTGKIDYSVDFKGWPVYSSPAIAGDMLYVGSTAGTMNAIDLSKQAIAWTYTTEGAKKNGAAFTKADGSSDYFGAFPSSFYEDVVAGYTRLETMGEVLSSPAVAGHVVYFGGTDGTLYALM